MCSTCPKCHQLYEELESKLQDPKRRCPRCAAVTELLEAADALNAEVEKCLRREKHWHPGAEFFIEPISKRAAAAISTARARGL